MKFSIGDYVASRKVGETFNLRGVIGRIDTASRQEKYLVRFEIGEERWLLRYFMHRHEYYEVNRSLDGIEKYENWLELLAYDLIFNYEDEN